MTIKIYEDLRFRISFKLLTLWEIGAISPSEEIKDGFICEVITLVVNLNVITVEVLRMVRFDVKLTFHWISSITNMILWKHQ